MSRSSPPRDLVHPIILSGGVGSRLWPLSRALFPKQFLKLTGDRSMIQDTALRVAGAGFHAPVVVCNHEHRFAVADHMHAIGRPPADIIIEPVGRNTAPAAAVAALRLLEEGPDSLMLIMPSDHVIGDPASFRAAVDEAATAAARGYLVTFGITPHAPETGYGYIKAGAALPHTDRIRAVERFVEKPNLERARAYLAEGGYSWNSGIFLFPAARFLAELEARRPAMVAACRAAYAKAQRDLDFCRLDAEAFAACPSESIDYAVMENAEAAAVVPVEMRWSDVGAWSALWDIGAKDEAGNVVSGDVVTEDVREAYIRTEGQVAAVLGLSNVVVVATDDAVLVADKSRAQDVKLLVDRLALDKRLECQVHTTVYRPWGSYRGLNSGDRYQVKLIIVNPGARLSLQMHDHRAEHWVVARGVARVTRGEESFLLEENQSTYIPQRTPHRLENPGSEPLYVVEVQSGSYLGEDDIVRFDDVYGRS